eukprot:TRINITY_DN44037_c0_g1_i2.p1 TRINITY_DN44037_c0_g1~~TRINITY_DN44037_c0_g1_i2.p1  ORF type:complete len:114 (-),score=1.21 TRINITY_DN44037_c0_g1_i2:328-669(-)
MCIRDRSKLPALHQHSCIGHRPQRIQRVPYHVQRLTVPPPALPSKLHGPDKHTRVMPAHHITHVSLQRWRCTLLQDWQRLRLLLGRLVAVLSRLSVATSPQIPSLADPREIVI